MNELVDNILKVYNVATENEKRDGISWYSDARKICKRLGKKYNVDFKLVCYVMAALSPNNRWHRNILDTERVLELFSTGELETRVALHQKFVAWKAKGGYFPDGENALKNIACTYNANLLKAYNILRDNNVSHLKGLKTNNFAQNIYSAKSDAITIDYHAISIATGIRHTIDTVKNSDFKGKNYEKFAEAYRTAAKKVGLKAYELQAITWTTWRNLDKVK